MERLQRGRGNLLEVMVIISRVYTDVKIVHPKHA